MLANLYRLLFCVFLQHEVAWAPGKRGGIKVRRKAPGCQLPTKLRPSGLLRGLGDRQAGPGDR